MSTFKRALLALLLLTATLVPARADERILLFISDVQVERDGELRVTETIRVRSEGQEIRRGILRDFPTRYLRRDGTRVEAGFQVESVTRDGAPEPFATERLSNGVRVRIGSADVLLDNRVHQYVITYRTTRQIGFFESFDELYWNATGTGWTFPIDVAEARITLPGKVPFRQSSFYTGPQGTRGTEAVVAAQEPGRIVVRTTRALSPQNGLTVAAAWEKGVVLPPSAGRRAQFWLTDNLSLVVAGLGLALLLGYYTVAWFRVGRDPQRGTVIPLFAPPKNMSAAAVRYAWHMDFDDRAFAAAVLDLGVRGHVRVVDRDGETQLEKRDSGKEIPRAEREMKATLFASDDQVLLSQANHQLLGRARDALEEALARGYEGRLFHGNKGWAICGGLLWIATALAIGASLFVNLTDDVVAGYFMGTVLASGGVFALTVLLRMLRLSGLTGNRVYFAFFAAGAMLAGLVMLLVTSRDVLEFAAFLVPPAGALLVAHGLTLLKAPTREGRHVMDQIEGLRQYLGVAEEDRLEALHPPEKTPELFERFLPYAVALDVENTWAQRFAGVLATAATAGTMNSWYHGDPTLFSDPESFATRLGSNLTHTVAAASTAPGDNSGSSGGGSSGGGGGGGGGSGW